jgi:diadenosine tetraphosphatase ApaH/serine/threonine PP2A family protein phosphatase
MLVAVLSDIHGNRHAFEAVLHDAERAGAEEAWCLGDLVGYGADPDACVEMARDRCAIVLAGNHDLAVTGDLSLADFSRNALAAAQWTQRAIAPENLEFLRRLAPEGVEGEFGLYHASPRDPIWEYVLSSLLAEMCLDEADQRVCFVGHSHVALSFSRSEGQAGRGEQRRAGSEAQLREAEWLVNPGSVGQPRDGDPRAAWLMLDTDRRTLRWHRVEYDLAGAQAAIRAAGLPDSLAERLGYGQ